MVLYFSATGNTAFIAKELAARLNDECLNLLDRVKTQDYTPLHSEKPFVICAPVYVCEMPRFLSSYLKKQVFTGSNEDRRLKYIQEHRHQELYAFPDLLF